MKTQLPFKSAPRQAAKLVGNEECGILEMPVYGSLVWHEVQAVRKADNGYNLFKESALVAGKIAMSEKRADLRAIQLQVISLMQAGMGLPPQQDIDDDMLRMKVEHASLLNDLEVGVKDWNDRRMLAAVTSLIQNRLPGFSDWDEVMVERHIRRDLMDALYAFFREEEYAQAEAQDDERNEVDEEEAVKKSSTATGKNQPSRTGEQSSGDSNSSTQEVVISPTNASEASPSSESSEPSKPAKKTPAMSST